MIDPRDADHPELSSSEQLEGAWITHVSAREDRALVSIGYSGAQWVEM